LPIKKGSLRMWQSGSQHVQIPHLCRASAHHHNKRPATAGIACKITKGVQNVLMKSPLSPLLHGKVVCDEALSDQALSDRYRSIILSACVWTFVEADLLFIGVLSAPCSPASSIVCLKPLLDLCGDTSWQRLGHQTSAPTDRLAFEKN